MKRFQWFARHKILSGVLVLLVIIVAASSSSANTKNANSNTASNKSTKSVSSVSNPPISQPTASVAQPPSVPAEYQSALIKATEYANTQFMSKQGVYDQLTSQYGEQFSAAAAQYAIDNVKADWNANALEKAKEYQSQQAMSPAAIHDQLTSSYGEQFTESEADYAIAHLND